MRYHSISTIRGLSGSREKTLALNLEEMKAIASFIANPR